jgi:hypothetical protein
VGGSRKKMQLFLIFAKNVGEEGKYSSKVGGDLFTTSKGLNLEVVQLCHFLVVHFLTCSEM